MLDFSIFLLDADKDKEEVGEFCFFVFFFFFNFLILMHRIGGKVVGGVFYWENKKADCLGIFFPKKVKR